MWSQLFQTTTIAASAMILINTILKVLGLLFVPLFLCCSSEGFQAPYSLLSEEFNDSFLESSFTFQQVMSLVMKQTAKKGKSSKPHSRGNTPRLYLGLDVQPMPYGQRTGSNSLTSRTTSTKFYRQHRPQHRPPPRRHQPDLIHDPSPRLLPPLTKRRTHRRSHRRRHLQPRQAYSHTRSFLSKNVQSKTRVKKTKLNVASASKQSSIRCTVICCSSPMTCNLGTVLISGSLFSIISIVLLMLIFANV